MVNKESIRFQKSWWHSSSACSFNARMVKCGGRRSVRCSCLLWVEESFRSGLAWRTICKTTSRRNRRCCTSLACQLSRWSPPDDYGQWHNVNICETVCWSSSRSDFESPALLHIHEWHSFSKINKSVCGWHFVLCDRQCSQLVRIKAPRTDRLPFDMVCQVASDCKSNKICCDGFSFKEDAGRKHQHNSWLTPSTTCFTSPASWSHLLRHTGLDKPRRHHCKSSFGQSWVSAPTAEAPEPVDHTSAIHYRKRGSVSYIVREWLLWVVERERERDACERERETPVTSIDITLKSRVIMHMITSTARRPNASTRKRQDLEAWRLSARACRDLACRVFECMIVLPWFTQYHFVFECSGAWLFAGEPAVIYVRVHDCPSTISRRPNASTRSEPVECSSAWLFAACRVFECMIVRWWARVKDKKLGAWALEQQGRVIDEWRWVAEGKLCVRWWACRSLVSLPWFTQYHFA